MLLTVSLAAAAATLLPTSAALAAPGPDLVSADAGVTLVPEGRPIIFNININQNIIFNG
ncbi:hypothetical protein [Streptomyces capparidis]